MGRSRRIGFSQALLSRQGGQTPASNKCGDRSMAVIALDIGGVLIENAGYDAMKALLGRPMSDQDVRTLWIEAEAVRLYETGQIDRARFGREVVKELGLDLSPDEFLTRFATWPGNFYPGAQDLVLALRRDYRCGCLSNSNELHWRAGFDEMFDFSLSSHRCGVAKPSPEIFSVLEHEAGVPRQEIYFFDDSLINVEAASNFGLNAYLALGLDGLKHALREAGVTVRM
jgi:putative hydrolase of the HAD superfamily